MRMPPEDAPDSTDQCFDNSCEVSTFGRKIDLINLAEAMVDRVKDIFEYKLPKESLTPENKGEIIYMAKQKFIEIARRLVSNITFDADGEERSYIEIYGNDMQIISDALSYYQECLHLLLQDPPKPMERLVSRCIPVNRYKAAQHHLIAETLAKAIAADSHSKKSA